MTLRTAQINTASTLRAVAAARASIGCLGIGLAKGAPDTPQAP